MYVLFALGAPALAQPAGPEYSVVYTARLFGKLRAPDEQSRSQVKACSPGTGDLSPAAAEFLKQLRLMPAEKRIVVGMGDNFAPELKARRFKPEPSKNDPTLNLAEPKEAHTWDYVETNTWLENEEVANHPNLNQDLAAGNGVIPADNVACFFKLAGYLALVPGKHDFYFGPERLRQLARLLAQEEAGLAPVQMLAANLSIVTTAPDAAPRLPGYQKEQRQYLPAPGPVKPDLPAIVLPWLRRIRIRNVAELLHPSGRPQALGDLPPAVRAGKDAPKLTEAGKPFPLGEVKYTVKPYIRNAWVCEAARSYHGKTPSDPYAFPIPNHEKCAQLEEQSIQEGDPPTLDAYFDLPKRKRTKDGVERRFQLQADANYGLCMELADQKKAYACVPFSVHAPFFDYRHASQHSPKDLPGPQPYALDRANHLAVFGVVHPELREHIGALNDGWYNQDQRFETKVEVSDPASALRQLMETCQIDEECKNARKILLAQMPPHQAEALAARLDKTWFDLVISQADEEQATGEETRSKTMPPVSAGSPSERWQRTFVAVPDILHEQEDREDGAVCGNPGGRCLHVPIQRAEITGAAGAAHRELRNRVVVASARPEVPEEGKTMSLRLAAERTLERLRGVRTEQMRGWSAENVMQRLALEVMRDRYPGDIAFLQRRDLYDPWTLAQRWVDKATLQSMLDWIFWKGDYAIRTMVTGSAISSVLRKSGQYDAADRNILRTELEMRRGLAALGVFAGPDGSLFVNGLPLENARLYGVVTTDYVGLGDTGYSELLETPPLPPRRMKDMRRLFPVTAMICRAISANVPELSGAPCHASELSGQDQLDFSGQRPFDTTPGLTPWKRTRAWFQPGRKPNQYRTADAVESAVQQRGVWSLALERLSAAYNLNQHNHGTEKRVSELFAGVPVSRVTSRESSTLSADYRIRLSRLAKYVDFFSLSESAYSRELTRQLLNNEYLQNQKTNMWVGEVGLNPRVFPSQKQARGWKGLLSARVETQLVKPVATFSLAGASILRGPTGRWLNLVGKGGIRFQGDKSWFETGYEIGEMIDTPVAYLFNPGGVYCRATDARKQDSLAACVQQHSSAGLITASSSFVPVTSSRPLQGAFLNFRLSFPLPLQKDLALVLENRGEWFRNTPRDVSLDTKYSDQFTASVVIPAVGNLSLVPKVDVFFYENKVDRNLFRSIQTSVGLQYRFDWHAGLTFRKALRYPNPPPAQ